MHIVCIYILKYVYLIMQWTKKLHFNDLIFEILSLLYLYMMSDWAPEAPLHITLYVFIEFCMGEIKGKVYFISYKAQLRCEVNFILPDSTFYETSKLNKVQLHMKLCKQPHLEGVNIPVD